MHASGIKKYNYMFLDFQFKITHNYRNSLNKRSLRLINV